MRKMKLVVVGGCMLMMVVLVGGCTSAGPYVTNISSDGKGNLIVEKNTIHMNAFTGAISSGDNPITQTIRVCPEERK